MNLLLRTTTLYIINYLYQVDPTWVLEYIYQEERNITPWRAISSFGNWGKPQALPLVSNHNMLCVEFTDQEAGVSRQPRLLLESFGSVTLWLK
jgi:hypothetical protein